MMSVLVHSLGGAAAHVIVASKPGPEVTEPSEVKRMTTDGSEPTIGFTGGID
jgi:hypothetical protein